MISCCMICALKVSCSRCLTSLFQCTLLGEHQSINLTEERAFLVARLLLGFESEFRLTQDEAPCKKLTSQSKKTGTLLQYTIDASESDQSDCLPLFSMSRRPISTSTSANSSRASSPERKVEQYWTPSKPSSVTESHREKVPLSRLKPRKSVDMRDSEPVPPGNSHHMNPQSHSRHVQMQPGKEIGQKSVEPCLKQNNMVGGEEDRQVDLRGCRQQLEQV